MSVIKSIKGLFGQIIHYKDGVRIGETWDGLISGTKNHYNADGSYAGSSAKGFLADEVHYDQHGRYVGESWKDDFGTTRHYGNNGCVGTSYKGVGGTTSIFDERYTSGTDRVEAIFEQPKTIFDKPKSGFDEFDSEDRPFDGVGASDSDDDSFEVEDSDW